MKKIFLTLLAVMMLIVMGLTLNVQVASANSVPPPSPVNTITLTKSVFSAGYDGSGKYNIVYRYTVKNIGNADPLYNQPVYLISITDSTTRGSNIGPIAITLPHSDGFGPYLLVGESATTDFTYIVNNPAEINDQFVINNAVATGYIYTIQWLQTTATASVTQPIPPIPELPAGALLGLGLLGIGGFILIRRRKVLQVVK